MLGSDPPRSVLGLFTRGHGQNESYTDDLVRDTLPEEVRSVAGSDRSSVFGSPFFSPPTVPPVPGLRSLQYPTTPTLGGVPVEGHPFFRGELGRVERRGTLLDSDLRRRLRLMPPRRSRPQTLQSLFALTEASVSPGPATTPDLKPLPSSSSPELVFDPLKDLVRNITTIRTPQSTPSYTPS